MFQVPKATRLRFRRSVLGALGLALLGTPALAADTVQEAVLESKYRRGDYGFYFGWYRPNDWQFREHAEAAYPFGVKVRFKLGDEGFSRWWRIEGDVSYYQRSNEPVVAVSVFQQPGFDGLSLAGSVQLIFPRVWILRLYGGGGAVGVSLSNDFVVWRRDVWEVDPDNQDQYALASWKKFDVGLQTIVGVDIPFGTRVFPFVEYRHLFGEVELRPQDIKIGQLSLASINLEVEEIETPPEDPEVGGRPYEPKYDWGGPQVMVGLKILF